MNYYLLINGSGYNSYSNILAIAAIVRGGQPSLGFETQTFFEFFICNKFEYYNFIACVTVWL